MLFKVNSLPPYKSLCFPAFALTVVSWRETFFRGRLTEVTAHPGPRGHGDIACQQLQGRRGAPGPQAPGCVRGPHDTALGASAPAAQLRECCPSHQVPTFFWPRQKVTAHFWTVLLYSRLFGVPAAQKVCKALTRWLSDYTRQGGLKKTKKPHNTQTNKQNPKPKKQPQNPIQTNKQKRISVVWLNRKKIPYSAYWQT